MIFNIKHYKIDEDVDADDPVAAVLQYVGSHWLVATEVNPLLLTEPDGTEHHVLVDPGPPVAVYGLVAICAPADQETPA